MKTLLIRPPIYAQSMNYPGGPRFGVPLSLLYLAAVLERETIPVSIYDALIEFDVEHPKRNPNGTLHIGASWEEIVERVGREKADCVGITNPFSDFSPLAIKTAQEIKCHFPKVTIVVGGPHASSAPESFLETESGIDYVIRGEGERSFVLLARALEREGNIRDVPGLTYRLGGEVRSNPITGFITDLDTLPLPAYHLLDMEKYFTLVARGFPSRYSFEYPGSEREISMITSRGCPFHCVFCGNHLHMGRRWRFHSAAYILRHMELLVTRYKVKHFHFEDDNITLSCQRFEELLDGIAVRKWEVTWDTPNGIRAEGLDEHFLKKIKNSGCTYLIVGIESGNQRVLNEVIKKNLDLDRITETARICKRIKLDLHGFYVIGFPGERLEEIGATFSFALALLSRFDVIPHLGIARPLPGTELQRICEDKGYLTEPMVPNVGGSMRGEVFERRMIQTDEFTLPELERLVSRFNISVGLRLSIKLLYWLAIHPVTAAKVLARFFSRIVHGPVYAIKWLFFSGLLFKNNFFRYFR
jgi:anaerobic magnesium-protoporphyrin IX monomethyl ester cyclase